jgi:signal transduction histidine kinase
VAWGILEGLPDDIVLGITDDAAGNLWAVTGKGVCRISMGEASNGGKDMEGQSSRLETRNGNPVGSIQSKLIYEVAGGTTRMPEYSGPRAVRSPDGRLWFATADGLLKANPAEWERDDKPPQVHLEGLLVNNEKTQLLPDRITPVRMPATLTALEIQFTALNFAEPEKLRFRHRLEGFDTDWVEGSSTERHVRYGRLPGGRYDFLVTACNADGVWNETGARFAFYVPTPLWRTPAVLSLYGLTAAGGIIGVVRLVSHRRLRLRLKRLQEQQAMERERVRIAQDMHDEIGSKLTKISFLSEHAKVELEAANRFGEKPQTTFRSMTPDGGIALRSATSPANPTATDSLATKIESIADTSREVLQALDEIVWAVNPRNDTLEQLSAYLGQYATEYFHNTSVECELRLPAHSSQQAMSAKVRHNVFLAFEESLNNVLKHSGASRVRIEITSEATEFRVSVEDNGHGFDCAPENGTALSGVGAGRTGNGLVNMRQRLNGIGGHCRLRSSRGGGTTVILSIQLNPAKAM